MRLLIIADGRSLNTIGWLKALSERPNISVHLISSYPAENIPGLASQHTVPVAFGGYGGVSRTVGKESNKNQESISGVKKQLLRMLAFLRNPLMKLRYFLGPLTLPIYARKVKSIIDEINPDVIHGLRIPFEGMLTLAAVGDRPFVVSIWGNDLTLHAKGSFLMRKWTRQVLENCSGLIADASRDVQLAKEWGLPKPKPTLVVPGGGGIPIGELPLEKADLFSMLGEEISPNRPIIVNPRGFRPGSVRNDIFFKAIPEVIAKFPEALFLCAAMAGEPQAEAWVDELGIGKNVRLLPLLPHEMMWGLFRRAQITTSISEHDGTPNSLLEAMACGSYPIAGDIESVREWVVDGENGRLVDPTNAGEVAEAIIGALKDEKERGEAALTNTKIIENRASRSAVAAAVEDFYQRIAN